LLIEKCDNYTGSFRNSIGETVQVLELVTHPNFRNRRQPYYNTADYNSYSFDFCLARVESINFDRINAGAAEGVTRVAVANFPRDHIAFNVGTPDEDEAHFTCKIAGWGRTGTYAPSAAVLRDTRVDVMSTSFCKNVANTITGTSRRARDKRKIYSRITGHESFCAGVESGLEKSRKLV